MVVRGAGFRAWNGFVEHLRGNAQSSARRQSHRQEARMEMGRLDEFHRVRCLRRVADGCDHFGDNQSARGVQKLFSRVEHAIDG